MRRNALLSGHNRTDPQEKVHPFREVEEHGDTNGGGEEVHFTEEDTITPRPLVIINISAH